MTTQGKGLLALWLLGYFLLAILVAADEFFPAVGNWHFAAGYELPVILLTSLALCTLAILLSQNKIIVKIGLVILTPVLLFCEVFALGMVGIMLHGLEGTQ